jgi:ubiquitin C-terminal hydrolase
MAVQMAGKDAKWGAGSQQDSHEFLIALLGVLQAECDRNTRKPRYRELKGTGGEGQQARIQLLVC